MNSKEYLNQYRDMMRLIRNLDAEIEELSERLTSFQTFSQIGPVAQPTRSPQGSYQLKVATLPSSSQSCGSAVFSQSSGTAGSAAAALRRSIPASSSS